MACSAVFVPERNSRFLLAAATSKKKQAGK
jgi:hypothetical protein